MSDCHKEIWSAFTDDSVFDHLHTNIVCTTSDMRSRTIELVLSLPGMSKDDEKIQRIVACVNALAGIDDPAGFMADVAKLVGPNKLTPAAEHLSRVLRVQKAVGSEFEGL